MIPSKTIFGGFAPPSERMWSYVKTMDVERIIFGLDNEDDDKRGVDAGDYNDRWVLRPQWRAGKLEATIARAHGMGLSVGVHYWGRPVKMWLTSIHRWLWHLHAKCGLDFVMGDFEKHANRMDPVKGGYPDGWDGVCAHLQADWGAPKHADVYPGWPVYGVALYGSPTPWGLKLTSVPCVREVVLMLYYQGTGVTLACLKAWEALGHGDKITMGYGTYNQTPAQMTATVHAVKGAGCVRGAWWQLRTTNKREAKAIGAITFEGET